MYSNPFFAVINHQPACRPPVWMMRQAGRVLPRYRQLTKMLPFRTIMSYANLAAEVTLMPIDDMGMDAAILFSDIPKRIHPRFMKRLGESVVRLLSPVM